MTMRVTETCDIGFLLITHYSAIALFEHQNSQSAPPTALKIYAEFAGHVIALFRGEPARSSTLVK